MPTPPEPKKRMQMQPPSGATHWTLWRVRSKHNASGNPGGRDKCKGEPGEDGQVPDMWPVADFSTALVLDRWGDGKYRVDWYDQAGALMKGQSQIFEVATPASKKPPQRPKARSRGGAVAAAAELFEEREETRAAAPQIAAGGGIGVLEMLTLLRAEREDAREREQQANDRNMQFMMQMQAQQTQLLTTLIGRPGGGSSAEESALLRRELEQTMREQMFAFRQELAANGGGGGDDPDDDPDDPPANLEEAGDRIGMAILADLEQRAPHLLQEMIPQVINFLKSKGFTPSADVQARAAVAANGHANGR
jgi:hypothetical protein